MDKESPKELRRFLWLLFLALLLILFDRQGLGQGPKSVIQRPLVWAEEKIFSAFRKTGEVSPVSEEKLRQLAVSQNDLNSCREENEKMRKLLGAPLPPQWKFLEARVIGQLPGRLRINKGQVEGVKEGANIIAENILVGKVISLGANDAWVQMVSSDQSKIPAVVKRAGSSGIQARGLLLGQGGGLLLDRVLQSEDIQKGDLVVTAGEAGPPSLSEAGWLPELLLGTVAEVLPKTAEVYQKAKVESLLNEAHLRIVFIVQ